MSAATSQTSDNPALSRSRMLEKQRKALRYISVRDERRVALASLPERKRAIDRKCLGCGVVFASKWCGNRMCEVCKDML